MSRGSSLNLTSLLQRVCDTILGEDGASAILPDRFVQSYNADMTSTTETQAQRYHGLDGLRGFAMLLGIVLHGSLRSSIIITSCMGSTRSLTGHRIGRP